MTYVTASCNAIPMPLAAMTRKVMLTPHFYHLDLRNTMMLLVSVTLTLAPMSLDEQKSHCASNIDHLDIRNIMMPSASYNANAGVNGVT